MPGSFCAIVGCPATSSRHRGLSFFNIRRPENVEWEEALVRSVNRVDQGFKKEKAKICSRHFLEKCFKITETNTGKGLQRILITGSLPTEHMPTQSRPIESSMHPERKPPENISVSVKVETFKYNTFTEVVNAASGVLPEPWRLIFTSTEKVIIATFTENFDVNLKVLIESNFNTTIYCRGLQAQAHTCSIESIPLNILLTNFISLHICKGIEDAHLQELAQFPSDKKMPYYRHVFCFTDEDNLILKSTIKSVKCEVLMTENEMLCDQCIYTKMLLNKRLKTSATKDISLNTPLHLVPHGKLTDELKKLRKENTKLQNEAKKFKNEPTNESPQLQESILMVMNTEGTSINYVNSF